MLSGNKFASLSKKKPEKFLVGKFIKVIIVFLIINAPHILHDTSTKECSHVVISNLMILLPYTLL